MNKENNTNQNQPEEVPPLLSQRKSSSTTLCDICFEPYHIMGRWPMLACTNNHFFCDHCIEGMFKYSSNEPVPCPVCRTLIRPSLVKPNYELFRAINKESTVKRALQSQQNQLFLYAFQHQIFQIAGAFKSGKPDAITKLTKLDCSKRKIYLIEHMQSFQSLTYLRLDNNFITIPSGLQPLNNLRFLNLSHNLIKDIKLLGNLKNLTHLSVQYNLIEQIPSFLPFSALSHFFLMGNPLSGIIADELLLIQFKNLLTISFSTAIQAEQKVIQVFLKGVTLCESMPRLYKIFVKDIYPQHMKQSITNELKDKVQVEWVRNSQAQVHCHWVSEFMSESHQYGQIFQFKVDPDSPYAKQYKISNNKLTKISDNFIIINSAHYMQKQGKINFKIKIDTPSQHIVMGLCNAFLKHNPNIYSEHFTGITLWGGIYSRGQYTALTGKLRLEDKPVIRMSVDFQNGKIRWFSDDIEVGTVPFPQQFKYSSLYFVIGLRDIDTSVILLKE